MKFHKTSTHNPERGFTLVEVFISIGILVVILAFSTPYTINFYQRFQFNAERNSFVAYLRQARTMAMDGQESGPHGVHVSDTVFTVFDGPSYAQRNPVNDRLFPRNDTIAITGPTEVAFSYLNSTTASVSFLLTSPAKQGTVQVNGEGRINYD